MTSETLPYTSYLKEKTGIMSWLFTLDHKRIGLMYLYGIVAFFLVGATLGLLMRFELLNPGKD